MDKIQAVYDYLRSKGAKGIGSNAGELMDKLGDSGKRAAVYQYLASKGAKGIGSNADELYSILGGKSDASQPEQPEQPVGNPMPAGMQQPDAPKTKAQGVAGDMIGQGNVDYRKDNDSLRARHLKVQAYRPSSPEEAKQVAAAIQQSKEQPRMETDIRQAKFDADEADGTNDKVVNEAKEARKERRRKFLDTMAKAMDSKAAFQAGYVPGKETIKQQSEQMDDLSLARLRAEYLGDAADQIEALRKGNLMLGRGFVDEATKLSTWDLGIADLNNNITLKRLNDKYEKGTISDNEMEALNDVALAEYITEATQPLMGNAYQIGASLPTSMAFMGEMIANPASGLGRKVTSNLIKKYGRTMLSDMPKWAVRGTVAGTRVLGDAAEAAILTSTLGTGHVASGAMERLNGSSDYRIDDNGVIHFDGLDHKDDKGRSVTPWGAVRRAWMSQFIENETEMLGEYLPKASLYDLMGKAKKGIGQGKLEPLRRAMAENVDDVADGLGNIMKKAHFDGLIGEVMEEEAGIALNTLTTGDQDWSDYLDVDQQMQIIASCAIMSGAFKAIESGRQYKAARPIRQELRNAEQLGKSAFGDERWQEISGQIDAMDADEATQYASQLMHDDTLTKGQKSAVAHYTKALMESQQFWTIRDVALNNKVVSDIKQLQAAYDSGYGLTSPRGIRNLTQRLEQDRKTVDDMGLDREAIRQFAEDGKAITELPTWTGLTVEEQKAAEAYHNDLVTYQGLSDRRVDDVNTQVERIKMDLDPVTRVANINGKDVEVVTTANMESKGMAEKPVYVIDTQRESAIVIDQDGNKTITNISALSSAVSTPREMVEDAYRVKFQDDADSRAEWMSSHNEETQMPEKGLVLWTEEGTTEMVTDVNGENGTVTVVPAHYDSEFDSVVPDNNAMSRQISLSESLRMQDDYYDAQQQREEQDEQEQAPEPEVKQEPVQETIQEVEQPEEQPEAPIDNKQEQAAVGTPQDANVANTEATAKPAQTEAEQAKERFEMELGNTYEFRNLGDEEYVQRNVSTAKKALDKAMSRKPKATDAAKVREELASIKAERDAAQKEYDFWEGVQKQLEANDKEDSEAVARLKPVKITPDKEKEIRRQVDRMDWADMTDKEYVAWQLARMKFTPETLKHELNWGVSERRHLGGHIAAKDKGGLTLSMAAHKIWEQADGENEMLRSNAENDAMYVQNLVHEVLSEVGSGKDLNNYVYNSRIAMAEQQAEAEDQAQQYYYGDMTAAHNFQSADEMAEYEEQERSTQRANMMTTAQETDYYSNLADENTEQYDRQQDGQGTEGVHGAGELSAPGTVVSEGEGGSAVLQAEPSGQANGQGEANVGRGAVHADTSVAAPAHAGEAADQGSASVAQQQTQSTDDYADLINGPKADAKTKKAAKKVTKWLKKTGVKARVLTDKESITDPAILNAIDNEGAKGWYDVDTNEVTLYLPNMDEADIDAEIDKTYIHEVVSHHGLRKLLGEDNFAKLCDSVWESMSEEYRKGYMDYVSYLKDGSRYKSLVAVGETEAAEQYLRRAAADECMAHIAENMDIEKMAEEDLTIWQKFVSKVKEILTDMGLIENMDDNTLSKLLVAAYKNLQAEVKTVEAKNGHQPEFTEGSKLMYSKSGKLIGIHNISSEKLRKVLKQGGLANPSVAVIDMDTQKHEGYGDISLILPSSMVDAATGRNAGTWMADAYTPSYPSVTKVMSSKGYSRVWKDIAKLIEDRNLQSGVENSWENYLSRQDNQAGGAIMYWFLTDTGRKPQTIIKDSGYDDKTKKAIADLSEGGTIDEFDIFIRNNGMPEKIRKVAEIAREYYGKQGEDYWEQFSGEASLQRKKGAAGSMPAAFQRWQDEITEYGARIQSLRDFYNEVYSASRHDGEANTEKTFSSARERVEKEGLMEEFNKWLASAEEKYEVTEKIFDDYTPSGKRRYVDNTLENVSRMMKRDGRNGAEGISGFNHFVAVTVPKVKSLAAIRRESHRLTSEEQYQTFREKWVPVYKELADQLAPKDGDYYYFDAGEARLEEAAQVYNPSAYIKKEYGIEVSEDFVTHLNALKDAVRNHWPAKYFETKFERPVYLREFAAAVVPENIDPELRQGIEKAGLPVYKYDSKKEGDRSEVVKEVANKDGIRFRKSIELGGNEYSISELESSLKDDVITKLEENGIDDVEVVGTKLIGSRVYGEPREDSDLDLLVEYKGDYKEDELFNILNDEPIQVDGIIVDVNPITRGKSGTIEQFMKRNTPENYSKDNDTRFMKAYHGSAAEFEHFDSSHFLEGEGSMAYGAGHYVSSNEDTAKMYANMATTRKQMSREPIVEWKGQRVDFSSVNPLRLAADVVDSNRTIADARQFVERIIDLAEEPDMKQKWQEALNILKNSTKASFRKVPVLGNRQLYEVEIPDDNGKNYIDWNKKPGVRLIGQLLKVLSQEEKDRLASSPVQQYSDGREIVSKEDLPSRIIWHLNHGEWENLYTIAVIASDGNKVKASKLLKNAGFVGIKVPTGNFKGGDGRGTNYVIFDDNDIQIKSNYRFRKANQNQLGFVSNAEKAVVDIKQEKAGADQWLAMLQKSGGIKAGEDKWLGLTDWLKTQKAAAAVGLRDKNITKDEILEFIGKNAIQIEEVKYDNIDIEQSIRDEFRMLSEELGSGQKAYSVLDRKYRNFSYAVSAVNDYEDLSFTSDSITLKTLRDSYIYKSYKDKHIINSTRLEYTTEGLTNKREIVLTVPTIEPYKSNDVIHFGDADGGRAIAWVRFGDSETTEIVGSSETPGGELRDEYKRSRVLVIDEVQSKRHQDGREQGYLDRRTYPAALEEFQSFNRDMRAKYGEHTVPADWPEDVRSKFNELRDKVSEMQVRNRHAIPDAPFDKNWQELAMKRMLRLAAEEGYDKLAWTKGSQQAKRYKMSAVVDRVDVLTDAHPAAGVEAAVKTVSFVNKNDNKKYKLQVNRDGTIVNDVRIGHSQLKGKPLAEVFGKEIAQEIMNKPNGESMIDLNSQEFGGEGMKGFYDQMLPSFMNKYCKKWGVKVDEVELDGVEKSARTMWSVDITPEMKESVLSDGQVMFRKKTDPNNLKGAVPEENAYICEDNTKILYEPLLNGKEEGVRHAGTGAVVSGHEPDNGVRRKGDNAPFNTLRHLEPGEFCIVERHYTQNKHYSFTSRKNRVESYDDVAYIFKALQDSAVENTFIALVKNGKPTIIHLGIGGIAECSADLRLVIPAINDIEPDAIFLVHNHPSGNLNPSMPDRMLLADLRRLGGGAVKDGIIIDTFKGQYSLFDEFGKQEEDIPGSLRKDKKVKIYSFDKQVYVGNAIPDVMRRPEEIASFITTQRLGIRGKLSALILSNAGNVTGNIHLPHTSIAGNEKAIAKEVSDMVTRMGGVTAVLYGNNIKEEDRSRLEASFANFQIRLLDAIKVEEPIPDFPFDDYKSDTDKESTGEEGVRYRKVTDPKRIEWFDKQPKVPTYKTVAVDEGGEMHAPMADNVSSTASLKGKVKTGNYTFGDLLEAEEHPEMVDENGDIRIQKTNGKTLVVAYDPYDHSSDSRINDQFKSAWERDNLRVIKEEIAQGDLDEHYRADKAMLSTGRHDWNKGAVGRQLPESDVRHVYLARYSRPIGFVDWQEVADEWIDKCKRNNIAVPFNVVPKAILNTIADAGVEITEPESGMGRNCFDAYYEWLGARPTPPTGTDDDIYSIASNAKAKRGGKRFSKATPEQDAKYMESVSSGDIDKAQQMVRDAFKAAFPETKIVNGKGEPVALYHGTFLRDYYMNWETGDTEMFNDVPFYVFETRSRKELGAHFGSKRQAETRAYNKDLDNSDRGIHGKQHIYAVYLNITNPLELEDAGEWTFDKVGKQLVEGGYITDAEYNRIDASSTPDYDMRDLLESKGFDGVLYSNKHEGHGISAIAFEPSQIKSADPVTYDDNGEVIPLSERFNESNEDIRFSIAGPKGMASLATADEGYKVKEFMRFKAQQMDRQGRSAKSIRLVTGWEKGKDGKWRYELPDGDLKEGWENAQTIGEMLDAPELFKAYPQIKDYQVEWEGMGNTLGAYSGSRVKVNIGYKMDPEFAGYPLREVLVHELQHAIQAQEGFATGSNMKVAERARNEAITKEIAAKYGLSEDSSEWFNSEKGLKALAERRKLMYHAEDYKPVYEFYANSAGEVEARNVQHRLDMSEEERKNTLLQDTEDVARDQQTINGVRFNRAYHGSKADFDKFDMSHVGEGEGGQAHGWGTYLSFGEGTASRYAEKLVPRGWTYTGLMPADTSLENEIVDAITRALKDGQSFYDLKNRMLERLEEGLRNEPASQLYSKAKVFTENLHPDDFEMIDQQRHLYNVEIPEDNGENYIDEMRTIAKPIRRKIADVVRQLPESELRREKHGPNWLSDGWNTLANVIVNNQYAGKEVRDRLVDATGSKKRASEILSQSGIVGMTYDGRVDGKCVVIFDEDDIQIESHVRFSKRNANAPSSLRSEYEQRLAGHRFREAMQDFAISIRDLQDTVAGALKRPVKDWENAYKALNRMSSVNKYDMDEYDELFYKPLLEEYQKLVKELKKDGMKRTEAMEAIDAYLIAKHGLERNEMLAKRDARRAYQRMHDEEAKLIRNDSMLTDAEKKNQIAALDATLKQQFDAVDKGTDQMFKDNREKDYSGLTALAGTQDVQKAEQYAADLVSEFERRHSTKALWLTINAATNESLRKSEEGGIIDHERRQEIESMFQYYVPLRGFKEDTAEDVYEYFDSITSPYSPAMKGAEGRKSLADSPIATIGNNGMSTIMQANRNKVKQTMLRFGEHNHTELMSLSEAMYHKNAAGEWEQMVAAIPDNATPEQAEALERKLRADFAAYRLQDPDNYKLSHEVAKLPYRTTKRMQLGEHQVRTYRDGVEYVLTINGSPRAAQALNGKLNPEAATGVGRVAGSVNRFLAANFTTRNPAFVLSNLSRDAIYANSIVWLKESPRYAAIYNKNWGVTLAELPGLIHRANKRSLDMNNELDRMFKEFLENGGETGYTKLDSVDDFKRKIARELRSKARAGVFTGADDVMRAIGNGLENFNRWAELVSRFTCYRTSRHAGRSINRSVDDAKEITVNFNTKGAGSRAKGEWEKGNYWNYLTAEASQLGRNLYVFWNAGVQGMMNFGSAMAKHPRKAAALASAWMTLGYAMAAMMSGGDDDDEENGYYLLPEYVRRNNIVFRAGNKWVKIPLSIELRALYGMGELAYSAISGNEYYDTESLTKAVVSQMSQVMPIDMMEGGGGLNALVPSSVKPFWELHDNKDWTGMPIYKDTPWNVNDPNWQKAYKSANQNIVDFAKWINEATGGNDHSKGQIDINPASVEHIITSYLGGIGTMAEQMAKSIGMAAGKREFDWRGIPVASRFIQGGDERAEEHNIKNAYFEYKEDIQKITDEVAGYRRDMHNAERTDEEREYAYGKIIEAMEKPEYEFYVNEWQWRQKIYDKAREEGDKEAQVEYMRQMVDAYREFRKKQRGR